MKEDIKEAQKEAEERYKLDLKGIIYNSIYAAITSTTGAAILEASGVITGSVIAAAAVVFITQIIPKLAKELDKKHSLNEARRNGYVAGTLEYRDKVTKFLYLCVHSIGHASQF